MATDDFSQSSAQVALFKECVAKAANDGRRLMDDLVETTRQALQQKAGSLTDPTERPQVNEAQRLLNVHAALLVERFSMTLAGALSEAVTSDSRPRVRSAEPATAAPSLRFDQLELMDESQVQESIELARAQQIAMAAAELQLAELNGLVCAVLGLKTVQPDRNPFRPEIYVKALRTVLTLTGADNRVRLQWMQFMGAGLGDRLKVVYPEISRLLESRGVRPVGYVVTQTVTPGQQQTAAGRGGAAGTGAGAGMRRPGSGGGGGGGGGAGPGGRTGGGGGGGGASGPSGPSGSSNAQTLLTVDQLRRLLAGELDSARQSLVAATGTLRSGQPGMFPGATRLGSGGGGGGRAQPAAPGRSQPAGDEEIPPHQDFDHTVPAAFEALEEMRQVEDVIKRLSKRKGTPATSAAMLAGGPLAPDITFDHLRGDARGVGQALGLEVVNLMFENITQDPHLLPPVQAIIRRVEPAYLRLALIDPRFFSDKQHVARRLLDQMTERSLAYATLMAPGFESFLKSMREAADALATAPVRDVEPFESALRKLEADWDRQARQEGQHREKAMHTLLHAEQRNLLAERLANDLRARPGANMAPAEIMTFLTGPWAQVLAEARLRDRKGSPDPGGYLAIVNDLIWTTQPEQTRMNLERIKAMIPSMLERLSEGLTMVDYPAQQIDAFSMMLMALYDNMQQPGQSTVNTRALKAEEQTANDPSADTNDPWLRATEMQDTGFLDVPEGDATGTTFKDTEPLFESTAPEIPESEEDKRAAERARPPIPPGAWVELRLHDQTLRAQLTWASPYGTLFMFTDAAGATHSLTRRAIDKLLARGSVTLITQGVVEDALDAVAQKAMKNSLDVNL